jgi:hypothetical protein
MNSNNDLDVIASDFSAWLEIRKSSRPFASNDDIDALFREYLSIRGIREINEYIGNLKALRNGLVYQALTDEAVGLGAQPKATTRDRTVDLLERYRSVPLHAVFLYTSEDEFVSDYILKNWGALDTLSGELCDIHPAINQFSNEEDAYDFIANLDVVRDTNFRAYSKLPGLFFWDNEGEAEYIPFGQDATISDIKRIVRIIFERIHAKPTIYTLTLVKRLLDEEETDYNKDSHLEKNMVDPYSITWALMVLDKATTFLFDQAGEFLKERREKPKNQEESSPQIHQDPERQELVDQETVKSSLNKQVLLIEEQSQSTAHRIKIKETESLLKQIEELHRNKLLYSEEATHLPSLDDKIAIRRRIEDIDDQIAEKANRMRRIIEQLSQQEIYIPALDG